MPDTVPSPRGPCTILLQGFSGYVRLALLNNCTTGKDNVSPHCPATNVPNSEADPYIDEFAQAIDDGSNVCTEGSVITIDKVCVSGSRCLQGDALASRTLPPCSAVED